MKTAAITILTAIIIGVIGFVGSTILEIYDVKAEVRSNKTTLKLIYDDVKIIKNHLIK